jgi:hypothetical protein
MNAGRPPVYNNPEELQKAISDYFENGVKQKEIIVGKDLVKIPIPTITGLCVHCGFESRQSFYAYELKPEFCYTIKAARLLIEQHYEELLQVGNTTGAIFALKNFQWTDSQQIEHSGGIEITRRIIE